VYNCYTATTLGNTGESEDRNCYINCYKLLREVLQALARNDRWQMADGK
jgi:hypothetical protein